LQSFDYAQPGAYFLTICAFERNSLFGRVRGDAVELSEIGRVVNAAWRELPRRFAHVQLDAYVIMPNHLHGILLLRRRESRDRARSEAYQKPVRGSLPTIVRSFKATASGRIKEAGIQLPHPVWQRNYFERVLRTGKEVMAATRYILENPARWRFDHENPDRERALGRAGW
jgi:REP element-mobilizing transposase RayT